MIPSFNKNVSGQIGKIVVSFETAILAVSVQANKLTDMH